jgi:DNA polymerase III subunit gamma/tau
MAERLKVHAWKACVSERAPRVRIPLSPPDPMPFDISSGAIGECSSVHPGQTDNLLPYPNRTVMGYLVLSRKYRPQCFEDVVRQTHVTRTLGNAIAAGRLAHAILFSGPRGTGKTTIARILAKCVNCASGPTATPCNTCQSCREITTGHAADVFEIDGASNNKVEHVRELRENAAYMPAHSKRKIYIIDEVHMLSDAAFNALLKILEEPPAHVMFMFATTEPNKIPITILSRCQRHDLRRIDINAIIAHMADLCRREGIDISEEGLTLIAREADGSIRDALSLLDQIICGAAGAVSTETVMDILGGIDRQILFDVSTAVFTGQTGKIIDIIDGLYVRGQSMTRCFSEILEHFRNLLLVKMNADPNSLADIPDHELKLMRDQVAGIPLSYLSLILDMLFKEEKQIKPAINPKLALEIAFIRVMQTKPVLSIDELINKIDRLQKGIVDAGMGENISIAMPPANEKRFETQRPEPGNTAGRQVPDDRAAQAISPRKRPEPHDLSAPADPTGPSVAQTASIAPEETLTNLEETPATYGNDCIPETDEQAWQKLVDMLYREQPTLAVCLKGGALSRAPDNQIQIQIASTQFNIDNINRPNNHARIMQLCGDIFGGDVRVSINTQVQKAGGNAGPGKDAKALKKEAMTHPLVQSAVKLFKGKIVDVKLL